MKRRSAFTLIELLVVIAIIALLIAVMAPALSAARQRAQRTTCQTRLREVASAIWAYSVANDGRVPYIVSPMTNGSAAMPGFGQDSVTDAEINPYDDQKWPLSLQNVLLPLYLGNNRQVFVCPSAIRGWPRKGGAWQMTYRDAGINQPNGVIQEVPQGQVSYNREAFGFLDGRPMNELRIRLTGHPLQDALLASYARGTYIRDMFVREGDTVRGPHGGGLNVVNREFGIEYRDQRTAQADLSINNAGARF